MAIADKPFVRVITPRVGLGDDIYVGYGEDAGHVDEWHRLTRNSQGKHAWVEPVTNAADVPPLGGPLNKWRAYDGFTDQGATPFLEAYSNNGRFFTRDAAELALRSDMVAGSDKTGLESAVTASRASEQRVNNAKKTATRSDDHLASSVSQAARGGALGLVQILGAAGGAALLMTASREFDPKSLGAQALKWGSIIMAGVAGIGALTTINSALRSKAADDVLTGVAKGAIKTAHVAENLLPAALTERLRGDTPALHT